MEGFPEGTQLKSRFIVGAKLGYGAFGDIFHGIDSKTKSKIAIKTEHNDADMPLLKMEVIVMRALKDEPQVPEFHACGRFENFNYVVMSLLGKSLLQLKKSTLNDRLSIQTSARIGLQMMSSLEIVHKHNFVHRDVKPGNFVMGQAGHKNARFVHVIDFGLCRMYRTDDGEIRPPRERCGFRGTVRYASVNVHKSKEPARHDDLWSFFYILVEMMSGQLPWRRLNDRLKVGKLKSTVKSDALLTGLPSEMHMLLKELEQIEYYDDPSYDSLKQPLHRIITRMNVKESDPYDWEFGETVEGDDTPHEATNLPVLATRNNELHHDLKDRTLNIEPMQVIGVGPQKSNIPFRFSAGVNN